MGKDSAIGWTHHTFNPWWGCVKVSPACKHCYAEAFAKRVGLKVWGQDTPRRFFGDKHWDEPLNWNRDAAAAGEVRRVFCASHADVLEDRADLDEHRARLWDLIRATPNLQWLLLTKRPERYDTVPADVMRVIWAGTTAEDQEWADKRVRHLLELCVDARVRFLSMEPLLGVVNVKPFVRPAPGIACTCHRDNHPREARCTTRWVRCRAGCSRVDWVIVGGESGPKRAELDLQAGLRIVVACRAAGVPVFVKQDSALYPGQRGRIPDEWWVQEFPEVRHG